MITSQPRPTVSIVIETAEETSENIAASTRAITTTISLMTESTSTNSDGLCERIIFAIFKRPY